MSLATIYNLSPVHLQDLQEYEASWNVHPCLILLVYIYGPDANEFLQSPYDPTELNLCLFLSLLFLVRSEWIDLNFNFIKYLNRP